MGAMGITLFTATFVVVSIYFGKLYGKFHISREIWFIIMVGTLVLLAVNFVYENFLKNKKDV